VAQGPPTDGPLVTGEKGEGSLTRHGLEEYVSDCVLFLDHRVDEQISTRRLRVVKYRGSSHGANEYPFLIDRDGFSVLPITSLGLDHVASSERVSTGIPRLDEMLGGKGYFKGSTVLVSGTAGTGKNQHRLAVREVGVRAREAVPRVPLRRVREPAGSQHAIDRRGPPALRAQGTAQGRGVQAPLARARDATLSPFTRPWRVRTFQW